MSEPKKRLGRKLLVAAVGVATINYVAACGSSVATEGADAGSDAKIDSGISSGNLVPPDTATADTGAVEDTSPPPFEIGSGNLVPPPEDTGP